MVNVQNERGVHERDDREVKETILRSELLIICENECDELSGGMIENK